MTLLKRILIVVGVVFAATILALQLYGLATHDYTSAADAIKAIKLAVPIGALYWLWLRWQQLSETKPS